MKQVNVPTRTEAEIVEELRSRVSYRISQTDLADKIGISRSYLSEVLAGKKISIGPRILDALGYDPAPRYAKRRK